MPDQGCSSGFATPAGVAVVLALALTLPITAAPPAGSVPQAAVAGLGFFTLPPCRVVDTRASLPLLPGIQFFPLAGQCGIPACARAVSANLTVVGPQAAGHLTIYAGDAQLPATSNLNFGAGQVRANSAIVQLADDGASTIGVFYIASGAGTADLLVDVNGYFESTSAGSGTIAVDSVVPAATELTQLGMVRIFGQGFTDPVAVSLAGYAAQVLCSSGTEIQVVPSVPVGIGCSAVQGPVHVTNLSSGESADGPQFTYLPSNLSLVSVSPPDVGENGGAVLSLTGSFPYADQTGVLIGAQAASSYGTATTTTLYVFAPPFTGTFPTQPCNAGGGTGTQKVPVSVDVTVTNPFTGCSSTAPGALTYIPNDGSCQVPLPPQV